MNRTIKIINASVWYHLETLKNYFGKHNFRFTSNIITDAENKQFVTYTFRSNYTQYRFIQNPKTHKFRIDTIPTLREINYVI